MAVYDPKNCIWSINESFFEFLMLLLRCLNLFGFQRCRRKWSSFCYSSSARVLSDPFSLIFFPMYPTTCTLRSCKKQHRNSFYLLPEHIYFVQRYPDFNSAHCIYSFNTLARFYPEGQQERDSYLIRFSS